MTKKKEQRIDFKKLHLLPKQVGGELNLYEIIDGILQGGNSKDRTSFGILTNNQKVAITFVSFKIKNAIQKREFDTKEKKEKYIKVLSKTFSVQQSELTQKNLEYAYTQLGMAADHSAISNFLKTRHKIVQAKIPDDFDNDSKATTVKDWSEEEILILKTLHGRRKFTKNIAKELKRTIEDVFQELERQKLVPIEPKSKGPLKRKKSFKPDGISFVNRKVRNKEMQINSGVDKTQIKLNIYEVSLVDGASSLMELLRVLLFNSIPTERGSLRKRSFSQNKDVLLSIVGLISKNEKRQSRLLENYILKNDAWTSFEKGFPKNFIEFLPEPYGYEFIENKKYAEDIYGDRFDWLVSGKTSKKSKADAFKTKKEEFEKRASLYLAGVERSLISRTILEPGDLVEFLATSTSKTNKSATVKAISSPTINEEYVNLLESSINPSSIQDYNTLAKRVIPEEKYPKHLVSEKVSLIEARPEQSKFRRDILNIYNNRCCVTGYQVEDALQAAHIVDYSISKDNSLDNGLCLRADIHILYDRGSLRIDKNYVVQISNTLKDTEYEQYNLKQISVPMSPHNPSREKLEAKYRQKEKQAEF